MFIQCGYTYNLYLAKEKKARIELINCDVPGLKFLFTTGKKVDYKWITRV